MLGGLERPHWGVVRTRHWFKLLHVFLGLLSLNTTDLWLQCLTLILSWCWRLNPEARSVGSCWRLQGEFIPGLPPGS